MGCHESGNLIVCAPGSVTFRRYTLCPTCKRTRRFVVRTFVWYDAIGTCCSCGDSWSGGERLGRPFRRGWRADESRRARREWAAAGARDEAEKQLREMLAPYVRRAAA